MGERYLFGFDCGTYESKGTLCDQSGNIVATASQKHLLKVPKPGYAEHDPIGDWWHDFLKIVRSVLDTSGIRPQQIAGICVSTIMAAITAVDANGNPLRNAILYGIDRRAQKQADHLCRKIGSEKIRQISGDTCSMESFGPKILWIRENEPEIYKKTKHFTFAAGFLNAKLTGRYCVDRYSAMRAQPMLDLSTMTWNDEMTSYVCDSKMLPEIVWSTDVIGTITKKAAEETGLAEGTPVMGGATDAGAEAVSVGVVNPGDTMIMYGSTLFLSHVTDALRHDVGLWAGHYVLKNKYCFTTGTATAGSLIRWIRDNFAKDLIKKEEEGSGNAYDALATEAKCIAPGADGLVVLPYFMGERMPMKDPKAKGVVFGLNLTHTRGHLIKAAYEGIAMGLDQNLEFLRKAYFKLERVMAVGGGTKSPVWLQTVSDVCGIEQFVPEVTFGASYGDALMAGLGTGLIKSSDAIKDMIKIRNIIVPNHEHRDLYSSRKVSFAELYRRNKDIMHQL